MKFWIISILACASSSASAFVVTLDSALFSVNQTFSSVSSFQFEIDIAAPLAAGTTYSNPPLNGVEYTIGGNLDPMTPSGFPAFLLERTISSADFYAQGSSLNFTIAANADLSDGLQISELSGIDPVFTLNAREVDTGRYHPSLFELNGDGSGRVQNSNNFGATTLNPSSGELVNLDFGEEYISDLTFDPATTTIAVPEPSSIVLSLAALLMATCVRRRQV